MGKYFLVLCILAFCYLVHSITIIAKDKKWTIGKPSPERRDTIAIEYKCVHGDRWGIYFDCGYRKWIHRLYSSPGNPRKTDN